MKNFIFALLVGSILFVVGCTTTRTVVEQPQESQNLKAEKPIVWEQALYPKLTLGDPIVFLNSTKIIIDGDFSTETFFLQDGYIYRMDSILNVIKTVGPLTSGKLIDLKKNVNGQVQIMTISFSANDATYEFNFYLKTDGAFTLNANAKLLFNEKVYKVQVSTKGGECLLLVNFFTQKVIQTINEEAEGRSVSGTKIIK